MEIEVLDCTQSQYSAGESMTFALRRVDNALANGFRRVMLAEVPTLAIDRVTVVENTSPFADEVIVHRLGLTPLLSVHARDMPFTHECSCSGEGCVSCEITASLVLACPDNEASLRVFASDISFDDPRVRAVGAGERGVYLLTIGRSQCVNLKLYIRKGIGKQHAKWMPVANVAMRFTPDIRLNTAAIANLPRATVGQWVARCPRNVFAYDDVEHIVSVVRPQDCIYCKECVQPIAGVTDPLVVVRQKRSPEGLFDFVFCVEGTGALPVGRIVIDAIDVLQRKLVRLREALRDDGGARAAVPTRRIGNATTAPVVLNQDGPAFDDADDNMQFVIA